MARRKPVTCPACGATERPIPIVYGLPTLEGQEEAWRGEVALGGCMVEEGQPEWACGSCQAPLPGRQPVPRTGSGST